MLKCIFNRKKYNKLKRKMPNIPRIYQMSRRRIQQEFNKLIREALILKSQSLKMKQSYEIKKMTQSQRQTKQIYEEKKTQIMKKIQKILPKQKNIQFLAQNIINLTQNSCQKRQIVEQKINTIISETIVFEALNEGFSNVQEKHQFMEQKKQEQQKISVAKETQKQLLTEINSFQNLIDSKKDKALPKEVLNNLKEKVSKFNEKKQKIRENYHAVIEEKQNQTLISCKNLDKKKINQKLTKKFAKNKLVQIKFNQIGGKALVNGLRGGAGSFGHSISYTINQEYIKLLMGKYTDSIATVMTSMGTATSAYKNALESYKLKISQLQTDFKSKKKQIEDKLENKNKDAAFEIQIVIVMDTTSSMTSLIAGAKAQSKDIFKQFLREYPNAKLKYGFVSYKDHGDTRLVQKFPLNASISQTEKFIDKLAATGGDDYPEAVHDGLNEVRNIGWSSNSYKFVFLIADAPPHGRQYYSGGDNYPGGCPCGISINSIASYYNSNKINFNFKPCGSNDLSQVASVFKTHFSPELFNHGKISKQSFSTEITEDLKKKMQAELKKLHTQITQEFKKMVQKVLEEIKKDVQEIVKEAQQLKECAQISGQMQDLKSYFDDVKTAKQTLDRIRVIQDPVSSIKTIISTSKSLKEMLLLKKQMQQKRSVAQFIVAGEKDRIKAMSRVGISHEMIAKTLKEQYPEKSLQSLQNIINQCLMN